MSTMMEELLFPMVNSSSNGGRGTPGKEQQAPGVGILLQIMMLILSFVLGHLLRRHKVYYLPEGSASLLIVMLKSRALIMSMPRVALLLGYGVILLQCVV
ncbi:hypothetical protein GIB67_041977 [Kingdonia uniflora]|uniref:Uncharacterized protein n=1 Tax=Kingdonia uniflora TaxID=39325 RepID=A0A7J7P0D9_9MAGN|nr:hypothetical protein GIB67_041977 [Kingdonia uniflora]